MDTEYVLSYTGSEIEEKLGKIDNLATKSEVPTKISQLNNDSGYLTSYTETDPTVPAWAKASSKPTYTASEVGADANGTASSLISAHNTATGAHNDMRVLISDLSTRVNNLTESDTVTTKVPDYWQEAIDNTVKKIQTLHDIGGKNSVTFAYFSDMHVMTTSETQNAGNTGKITSDVMNKCDVPFAIFCGDALSQSAHIYSSEDEVDADFSLADSNLQPIGWDRLLRTRGNHDGSWGMIDGVAYARQYNDNKLYNRIYRKDSTNQRGIRHSGADGSYYYVDHDDAKLRIVSLNSLWCVCDENDNGSRTYDNQHYFGYGQEQFDWLINTALNVDDDWTIVLFTHVPPIASYADVTRDYDIIRGVLSAYVNRDTYTGDYTPDISRNEGDWAMVSVEADFTDAKGVIAGFFCGHAHKDQIISNDTPYRVITITSDANIPYDTSEEVRVFGTDNEHAVDFVTIDTVNEIVYLTRLGVGASRSYSYGETAITYVITHNLANLSSSNISDTVVKGSAYVTYLSPVRGWFDITNASVTMGGTDVTTSVYENGEITIDSVSGDVVITATATPHKTGDDTNLLDTASIDWVLNQRINSSENVVSASGVDITNYIELNTLETYTLTDFDIISNLSNGANYGRIYFYDENKSYTNFIQPNISDYETAFTNINGTITVNMKTLLSIAPHIVSGSYIRFGGISGNSPVATLSSNSSNDGDASDEPTSYTNLADTSSTDWVADSRISSSGSIKSSTGAVVTNFITAKKGDTIRIKGLDLLSKLPDGTNNPSIQGYDASGAIVADTYFVTNSYADLFHVGEDGVTTHVLYQSNGGTNKDNVTQIRICGTPIEGQEIIITVNEEII